MTNRRIIHLDIDCFFVACELLRDSRLKGKPVIVGGTSGRGVVASCSYEARTYGVHAAMPIRYALQRCPDARVIKGDMDLYANYSKLVTTIIREQAPVFEKASMDEFYIDMTGMDQFGSCYQWVRELEAYITKESGLAVSFGLSVNKTVAKMATNEGKPSGKLQVPQLEVQPFLNPLAVRKIPQLGQKTAATLSRVGVRRIQTLAEMPLTFLERLFGQHGRNMWHKANGIDEQPIVPYKEQKSISAERTFQQDTIDLVFLRSKLIALTEQLTFELRESRKLTAVVTVKLRYTNFDTHTRQKRIPYTADDEALIGMVLELFDQLFQRRMLIRLVGVKFSGLVDGFPQMSLFDQSLQQTALHQALDQLRGKYGMGAVRRASTLPAKSKDS